jgi:hypothetical protein
LLKSLIPKPFQSARINKNPHPKHSNVIESAFIFQLTALSSQLTFDITTANTDSYIQALPDGEFAAVDGRPSDV